MLAPKALVDVVIVRIGAAITEHVAGVVVSPERVVEAVVDPFEMVLTILVDVVAFSPIDLGIPEPSLFLG